MKRLLSILLCAFLVLSLVACGGKEQDKVTFTVGFDAEFPPYGFQNDQGEYDGFDLELAREVCSRRGWEFVAQPIDWNAKDMELESGSIDCIWNGFTMSDERLDKYTWSKPYMDNSQVFVVAADSGIKTQADLAGKVVVTQEASSALEALEGEDCTELTASFKELLEVPDYNTAFLNLEAGGADAIAMDIGVAKFQVESRGGKFVILDEPITEEKYAIGFKLGNTDLKEKVEETLTEMYKDGTFTKISDKWGLTDSVIFGK